MTGYEQRIAGLADKAYARDLFGIKLLAVEEGSVTLTLPHRPILGHRPTAFQGAIVSAVAEYAAAWSSITQTDDGWNTLTIQQTISFIAPAQGDRLVAVGSITSRSRSISFAQAEVYAEAEGARHLCAIMMQTNRHSPARR